MNDSNCVSVSYDTKGRPVASRDETSEYIIFQGADGLI